MKKTAIITGAGSGIGRAAAFLFSQKKWSLILLGRDLNKLEKTKEQISDLEEILIFSADLAKSEDIATFSKAISHHDLGQICLVNNAGIFMRNKDFVPSETITKNERPPHQTQVSSPDLMTPWLLQFQINLFGTINLTQAILPLMKGNFNHSIVNVSSTLGLRPSSDTGAYSASKAAMVNWTQSLALQLAPQNIRVNCICPGLVDTPIHKKDLLKKLQGVQPLGRTGEAHEIAQGIYFLGSEESSWTTGAILSIDGGINLS